MLVQLAKTSAAATDRRVAVMCGGPRTVERRPRGLPLLLASGERDAVVLEREGADALAGGGGERVEHRRRGDADGRLTDAAPETAARHHDRLDLRHGGDPHR